MFYFQFCKHLKHSENNLIYAIKNLLVKTGLVSNTHNIVCEIYYFMRYNRQMKTYCSTK